MAAAVVGGGKRHELGAAFRRSEEGNALHELKVHPEAPMKKLLAAILAAAVLPALAPVAQAQSLDDLFRKVNPSVVVVRAKGRDVGAGGVTRFNETGSGVLISSGGRVMTAAHVVNAMDEITVEGVAGEAVRAKLVSSDAAADVSMLQLERVTAAMRVARIGDSDTVRVGQQVMVVGAPYGLAHSMSVGWISARWRPNTVYKAMPLAGLFQTDAVINQGNSGGPMFNLPPKLLGYLVTKVATGSPGEAIGLRGGTRIDGESIVVGGDIILAGQSLELSGTMP